jgi:hypothetical protein
MGGIILLSIYTGAVLIGLIWLIVMLHKYDIIKIEKNQ